MISNYATQGNMLVTIKYAYPELVEVATDYSVLGQASPGDLLCIKLVFGNTVLYTTAILKCFNFHMFAPDSRIHHFRYAHPVKVLLQAFHMI